MSVLRSNTEGIFVPGTAELTCELEALYAAALGGTVTQEALVPSHVIDSRTALLQCVLQALQVSSARCCSGDVIVPLSAVLVCVLQATQVISRCSVRAGVPVLGSRIRAPVLCRQCDRSLLQHMTNRLRTDLHS